MSTNTTNLNLLKRAADEKYSREQNNANLDAIDATAGISINARKQQTLTDAASISWNSSLGCIATVTLGGNRTLNNPDNIIIGATYKVFVVQDSTGGRTLSYGNIYLFPGGNMPVLSSTTSAIDCISFLAVAINSVTYLLLDNYTQDYKAVV